MMMRWTLALIVLLAAFCFHFAAAGEVAPAWHFTTKDGNFNLWLPAGKPLVRGIFVFPFYGSSPRLWSAWSRPSHNGGGPQAATCPMSGSPCPPTSGRSA